MTTEDFHSALEAWEDRVAELDNDLTRTCQQCVIDTHLWTSVVDLTELAVCNFCGTKSQAATFEDLAAAVVHTMDAFYVSVSESGAYHDDGDWSENVEDVQVVLDELLYGAVDNDVLKPLVAYIAGQVSVDYGYVLRHDVWATLYDADEGAWGNFMTRTREGKITATHDILDKLPDDAIILLARVEYVAQVNGLLKHSTPTLWRCRPGTLENEHRTGAALGSPPSDLAGSGRLNVENQPVFYGSTTLRGALNEMVSHYSKDVEVWGAQFIPSRPLYYLDLVEPPELPSSFELGAADTHRAISFLMRFAETISQPATRDVRHYLPTQILVAFLLRGHEDFRPEAIRYRSSVDPESENWAVFVDNAHCVDQSDDMDPTDTELFMRIDPGTTSFVVAHDYL